MGYPSVIWLAEVTMQQGAVVRRAFKTRERASAYVNEVCRSLPAGKKPQTWHVREVDFHCL